MCGITGFIDRKGSSAAHYVAAMTDTLQHRGPDGQGTFYTETPLAQVGLGHRRLSIIDLSAISGQPMHYNGLNIVFNGELYNYQEIKNDLLEMGHQFQTSGDTEVIVHAWQEWGEKAIERWHGMFAIALYDEQKQELICIRDRAGVKPLYYHHQDGLFLFGSELKSITAHPGFKKSIDRDAVAAFLQYGYVPAPHCIYNHTYKLKPGHLLRLCLSSGSVAVRQYWNVYDYYNKPKLDIGFAEAKQATAAVLQQAFMYRMVADVPVGVFLSGGFDSTCVAALLQKDSGESIRTFTIGTPDPALDEAPYARAIAAHLGTAHTEYYCTPREALDIIPDLPFYFDEPFADSSAIPTLLVSRMAKKDVTVALSADAGDEVFAGYNRYDYLMRYGRRLNAIPKLLRKSVAGVMNRVSSERIPYLNRQANFHSRYQKVRNLLQDPSPRELLRNLSQVFNLSEIASLFAVPVTELETAHVSNELQAPYADPLSYMMAVDYQTYLADDILQKVDRCTMAASLEGREPFLDQSVIEWAAQLPNDFKYHRGEKKYILKQIVYDHVPRQLMDRGKMGFGIPVERWLGSELRELLEDHLSEKALSQHGLFRYSYVAALKQSFFKGHTELHLKLWYLLMFQMWYQRWMRA